jgi:type I restriction enzyme R subunit
LLESERVREGLRDILLGPAQLYEALRNRSAHTAANGSH